MLAEAIPPPDKQDIRLLTIFFGMQQLQHNSKKRNPLSTNEALPSKAPTTLASQTPQAVHSSTSLSTLSPQTSTPSSRTLISPTDTISA
jgi:hypothetical protein